MISCFQLRFGSGPACNLSTSGHGLRHQPSELLVIGLARPEDGNRLDLPNLVEAHHATEAVLDEDLARLSEREGEGREQRDLAAARRLDPLHRHLRAVLVGG